MQRSNIELKIITHAALFCAVLFIWHSISYSNIINHIFLPSPQEVFTSLVDLFIVQNLHKDIWMSLLRISIGFISAALCAIPLGILLSVYPVLSSAIGAYISFIRYTPISAFIPLFVLWFGVGENEKIFIIFVSVFFQLVLMIANSVSIVPREMIETAKTFGATRFQRIMYVILPHAYPRIINDLRVSMGWAWASLMIAEIVGATSGLGFVIIQSQRLLQVADIIAVIIIIGLIGVIFDYIFIFLSKILFPWANHV